ncbi:MAG: DUF4915 domain-containing protein [Planctomycetes bacterium]|nr:DUF4915 domain-containing protein [Planctomycetota bacterium]
MNELLRYLKQSHGRRIVLFGTGSAASDYLSLLPFPAPAYAVDNDPARWGSRFEGLEVHPPAVLRGEATDSVFVVIAACSAIEEIITQLSSYGFRPGIEFSPSPFLERHPGAVFEHLGPLLVSCIGHKGGLYRVDPVSGDAALVVAGDFRGLARHPQGYLAVHEHEGFTILGPDLEPLRAIAVPNRLNLHGVAVDPEQGRVYVNETALDRIGIYDLTTLERCGEIVPPPDGNGSCDMRHVNDVAVHDGALWVTMFSHQGVWRDRSWRDGVVMRLPLDGDGPARIVHRHLRQPHSLLFADGKLLTCNSLECEVLEDGEPLFAVQGYTRGLACVHGILIVGQSRIRRLDRFPARLRALSLDCGLHLWDRNSRATRFVPLPAEAVFAILPAAR